MTEPGGPVGSAGG